MKVRITVLQDGEPDVHFEVSTSDHTSRFIRFIRLLEKRYPRATVSWREIGEGDGE